MGPLPIVLECDERLHRSSPARSLSLHRIAAASDHIDPVFLGTPQFVCEPLSEQLGCTVTLKVETLNPIGCFKGRGAELFLSTVDAAAPLACASAGNFGQALAYGCRKRGISLVVYAARTANPLKVERMRGFGAEVRLEGEDFDAAKEAARAWAALAGVRFVEDGQEPLVAEGAGSIAVELLSRRDMFDVVVVPVGNGALITGLARWLKAASPATRIIGVCPTGAPAMAHAWRDQGATAPHRVDTIADGIAIRAPIARAVADMRSLVDDVVLVDDRAMVASIRLVHRHTGLLLEPAGVVGVAAIASHSHLFARLRVATVLCGSNVTPAQARAWLGESQPQ